MTESLEATRKTLTMIECPYCKRHVAVEEWVEAKEVTCRHNKKIDKEERKK